MSLNNPPIPTIPQISPRTALHRLEAFIPTLLESVHAAFEHGQASRLLGRHGRARASLMCAQFEDEARSRLSNTGAAFIKRHDRFMIGLANTLVRLKKVNADYQTSNHETHTSRDYDRQIPLPGLPDLPRLTLAYRVSELGDKLLDVALVYARGRSVLWVEPLLAGPSVQQLPLREPRRTGRVKIRPASRPKSENDGES